MNAHFKILKGTSFLSVAEVVTQGCSLARNVILARFLTKSDFGVAAMLGMILTLFEMSGKMALGQQVIQSPHGDEPRFVSAVHFTQFAAGAVSAVLILVLAWPLAQCFPGPQYFASIMMLALIPFITGLNNLDVYRRTRRLGFGPLVLTDTVPQVATTLAAWPLAAWFRDYRAVLWLLLGKAFLNAAMTHLLAQRRYSLRLDGYWLRESLKFGWPLLLSGFIQFGNFQGDSMVVAASYTMSQLGEYSVALTMAVALSVAILRISAAVGLPLLAEVQHDVPRFVSRYSRYAQIMALVGCCAMLGVLFCGEQFVVVLFGAKYAGVGALACWLTAAQGLRILRGAAVVAAMAKGDTVNNLVSSSWRLSGLLLAVLVGVSKASLAWFAVAAFVGEAVALWAALARLASEHSLPSRIMLAPALLGLVLVLFGELIKWCVPIGHLSYLSWLLLPATMVLSVGVFAACFPELRSATIVFIAGLRAKAGSPVPGKYRAVPAPVKAMSSDTWE
ncbi:MAG TPA: oligosaccharide flippase family protein [Dongiaceae bacterium]|nr:oligosaccharide flippase family protein [Dongiaceae bacterium]